MLAPCFFCTTCSSLAHHPALTSDAAYRRRQIEAVTAYDYTCGVFRIRAANTGPDAHTSDLFHFTVAVNALDVSLEGTFCFACLNRESYRRESLKQNMKKRYGHKKFV
jgi:hypothetical protein